jgi:DNA-binding transcriptional ArsR family regulator
MASTGRPPLRGLAALVGSEGKRQVLLELSRGSGGLTVRELVERTGLQRNTVRHSLHQLSEAHLVTSRRDQGRLIAAPAPERVALLADLATLDDTSTTVQPVPGRMLSVAELDSYEKHLDALPRVVIDEDFSEDELTVPLSSLFIGDPVD